MYTTFLGFKEKPFNLTPDPRYLFLSRYHKEALDHLLYAINERKGFVAITGGIGAGKTTLCRTLLSYLKPSTKSALIFNSFVSDRELLETVMQEFGLGVKPFSGGKKEYIDAINSFLLKNFSRGGNAVLIIDEAQNLSPGTLEQIRMLSNLETEKEKLIQIVLAGQTELKELLAIPSLRQLDERITVRYELRPLDRSDVKGYVEHRVGVGGGGGNVRFARGALKEIYQYSHGNPRRINAVCDRALLVAYVKGKQTVSRGMVRDSVDDFRSNIMVDPLLTGRSRRGLDFVTVLMVFLIMAAGLAGWNFRNHFADLLLGEHEIAAVMPKFTSHMPPRPQREQTTIFLDEKTSLAGLYQLYKDAAGEVSLEAGIGHLTLVSFMVDPEYYVMFKKPFRLVLSDPLPASSGSPRYLLICKVTKKGGTVLDAGGDERSVSREFLLKHWGRHVSWFYPTSSEPRDSVRARSALDVFEVQKVLNKLGYLVNPTGAYDKSTVLEVAKFQKDFGLVVDGIVGARTGSLLYQMTD